MIEEMFRQVAIVLPILLLLPLVWLVVGFLVHSLGWGDNPVEEAPPTRSAYFEEAVIWLAIGCFWTYNLVQAWRDPSSNWFWSALWAIAVFLAVVRIGQSLVQARRLAA